MTRTLSPTSSIDTASYELLGCIAHDDALRAVGRNDLHVLRRILHRRRIRGEILAHHVAAQAVCAAADGHLRPAAARIRNDFDGVPVMKLADGNPRLCWADRACSADCSDREPLSTTALCAIACPPQSISSAIPQQASLFFIATTPSRGLSPRDFFFCHKDESAPHILPVF